MVRNILLGIVILGGVALISAIAYGAYHWDVETGKLRSPLNAAQTSVQPSTVDFRELDGLPPPVQRYFRAVLQDGQPMVMGAHVHHRGTFKINANSDQWQPFTSDQQVVTQRPGFLWNGRISILPGIPVRVHDAYVAGTGILHAALFGLVSVVNLRGTGDLAEGELMRFFAEAAWYPTALLPSQGVQWEAKGDRSAYGTLTDGTLSITILFTFDDHDFIERVWVEDRGRMVGDQMIPTPWQGHFWNYQERNGMLVPLEGEVAWLLPEGESPYWRGYITEIQYDV